MTEDELTLLEEICGPEAETLPDGVRLTMLVQAAPDLIAEVRRLREGWRPISEAPLWETVLVYQKEAPPLTSNRSGVFSAVQVSEGKWALSGQYGRKTQAHSETLSPPPTHFMPLPTPPQDSATD